MEAIWPIIVQIIGGIIGGQGVGAVVKQAAMSQLPKILSGAIGGVGGGQLVDMLSNSGVMDGLAGDAIGGVGGGAILTAIVGMVMKSMNKSA